MIYNKLVYMTNMNWWHIYKLNDNNIKIKSLFKNEWMNVLLLKKSY